MNKSQSQKKPWFFWEGIVYVSPLNIWKFEGWRIIIYLNKQLFGYQESNKQLFGYQESKFPVIA